MGGEHKTATFTIRRNLETVTVTKGQKIIYYKQELFKKMYIFCMCGKGRFL